MTNIIDYTYFTNRLLIANLQSTTDLDVRTHLTALITQEQYNFLNGIMGPALYEQFVEWYITNPGDTTNDFYYLLNGKVFTDTNGNVVNWIGMINTQKLTPLANYVYYIFQELNFTQTTSAGEVRSKADNSYQAYPDQKLIDVWSQMVDWLRGYGLFMDTFYGTTGALEVSYNLLPYKAPIQIQVGATVGLVAGTQTFTFDGSSGTYDWRGYDVFPERIGQGTMIRDVMYTWDIDNGIFTLLISGDALQPAEYFNITFGLGGITFIQLTSNVYWSKYRCQFYRGNFSHKVNFLDA